MRAISTALREASSQPSRIFTVNGRRVARRIAVKISSARFGSRISADPSPFLTTFGAGHPILKSRISAVPSSSIYAAASAAILADLAKICIAIGRSSGSVRSMFIVCSLR